MDMNASKSSNIKINIKIIQVVPLKFWNYITVGLHNLCNFHFFRKLLLLASYSLALVDILLNLPFLILLEKRNYDFSDGPTSWIWWD